MTCLSIFSHGDGGMMYEVMGSEHLTITELPMDFPVNQNVKVSNM